MNQVTVTKSKDMNEKITDEGLDTNYYCVKISSKPLGFTVRQDLNKNNAKLAAIKNVNLNQNNSR